MPLRQLSEGVWVSAEKIINLMSFSLVWCTFHLSTMFFSKLQQLKTDPLILRHSVFHIKNEVMHGMKYDNIF